MKFVFFGSPDFAREVLRVLILNGQIPVLVVTNPDRPVGRKKIITAPPVKTLALEHKIPVRQPENVRELIGSPDLECDFFVVAAYSAIIPQVLLSIPKQGSLGVHPSLLPRLRGSSPIQGAILTGLNETGVTIYRLDSKMDHGPILKQCKLALLGKEYYLDLQLSLASLGGKCLLEVLQENPSILPLGSIQDEALATYTSKFTTEDAHISEDDLVVAQNGGNLEIVYKVDRMVRALNPEPGAWTNLNGKRTKILRAKIESGRLILQTIQPDGSLPKNL